MLACLRDKGLLKVRGRMRTDSTHILAAIRNLSRLECIGETIRQALNVLATIVPDGSTTLNRGEVATASFLSYGSLYVEQTVKIGHFQAETLLI
jgi:tryptophan 2,3-dioxygenase